MLLSINHNIINKNERGVNQATGFVNVDLDQYQLAGEIYKGVAFSTQHRNNRDTKNFLAGGYIALDFDHVSDDEMNLILNDPVVKDYYGIFYYTVSSTADNPRFRILFELDKPITDAEQYRKAVRAFIWRFAAQTDSSCSDPARLFYGAKDRFQKATGQVLSKGVLDRVLGEYQSYLDDEEAIRKSADEARKRLTGVGGNAKGKAIYLAKVIESQATRVRNATKGTRHYTLRNSALVLGGYLAGEPGLVDEFTMRSALESAYSTHNPDRKDMRDSIDWGFEHGRDRPITIPELPASRPLEEARFEVENNPPVVDPETGEVLSDNTDLASFMADDDGNADAFLSVYGDEFLYCEAYGWLHYTGTHWETNLAEQELQSKLTRVLRARRAAGAMTENEGVIKASKPSRATISNCLYFLTRKLEVLVNSFDNQTDLLNCSNGVLDLRTGVMTDHNPAQRYTYCLPTAYKPDSHSQEWLDFLAAVVGGGQGVVDYLQEALGYSLTGSTREEVMFYLYGPSRSGKGTLTELILSILGRPLSTEADFNTFTAKRDGDSNNFDLAPLKPSRAVFASESNRYQSLNPAKIKQLTGGNEVYCCFKHKDFFNYRPQYKIWLSSNQPVSGDVDDDALWGRLRVIEMPNSFLGQEDKALKERLKRPEHKEAALAWMVVGAMRWYARGSTGLVTPQHVKDTTQSQRDGGDYVQAWLDECCLPDQPSWVSNAELMASYTGWCKANNIEAKQARSLSISLKQKGYAVGVLKKQQGNVSRGVQGLYLVLKI